jgi:hypothetical protein
VPQADLNLCIKTFFNGRFVSNIVLDTRRQAADTIDYVATDSQGMTAHLHPHRAHRAHGGTAGHFHIGAVTASSTEGTSSAQ